MYKQIFSGALLGAVAITPCEARSVNEYGQPCLSGVSESVGNPIPFTTDNANGDYRAGQLTQDYQITLKNICKAPLRVQISHNCNYSKTNPGSSGGTQVEAESEYKGGYPGLKPGCTFNIIELTALSKPDPVATNPQVDRTKKTGPLPSALMASNVQKSASEIIAACVNNDETGIGVPATCDTQLGATFLSLCKIQRDDLQKWCSSRLKGLPLEEIIQGMIRRQWLLDEIKKAPPQPKPLPAPRISEPVQPKPEKNVVEFSISEKAMQMAKNKRCAEYDYESLRAGTYAYGPLWETGPDRVAYALRCSPIKNLKMYCEEATSETIPERPAGVLHIQRGQYFCQRK